MITRRSFLNGIISMGAFYHGVIKSDSLITRDTAASNCFKTGIKEFDAHIAPLCPGELVVVSGNTSVCKLAIMRTIIRNTIDAVEAPIMVFPLVLSNEHFIRTMFNLSRDAPVSGDKLSSTWFKYRDAPVMVSDNCIYVQDMVDRTLSAVKQFGVPSIIAVLYFTLLSTKNDVKTRGAQLNDITRQLNRLKTIVPAPILALMTLSTDGYREGIAQRKYLLTPDHPHADRIINLSVNEAAHVSRGRQYSIEMTLVKNGFDSGKIIKLGDYPEWIVE